MFLSCLRRFEDQLEADLGLVLEKPATREIKAARSECEKKLYEATIRGNWRVVKEILEQDKDAVKYDLSSSGDKLLHIAAAYSPEDFVENLLLFIEKEEEVKETLEQKNKDGSTALHEAVSVGNKHAMKLLVHKHKDLLTISDIKGQDPLMKASNRMRIDIFSHLLKVAALDLSQVPDIKKRGVNLVVNMITAKQYLGPVLEKPATRGG
ncbi:hypothetical protein L6452_17468 [Arctium lappa]|uniref:Uncharacterized protein n=1 Tax=Arctium lappa TaxID=4217 RepID=A0ACB9C3H5_ARCLA|nr:hypothetical protein L6452_17468 [Arctium lappa]